MPTQWRLVEQACQKVIQGEANELRVEIRGILKRSNTLKPNITEEEGLAPKELSDDRSRLILTTDKAVAIVVMGKTDYVQKSRIIIKSTTNFQNYCS